MLTKPVINKKTPRLFLLQIRMEITATRCLYRSKNLGISKTPQSRMEGLTDKSVLNSTEDSDKFE
ncbi:hypothetical protein TIFTF001_053663 [Ficus carica]|uniref:Uncharacterized protein n=1 Tax=Ficus carica TaxID=3494 RepID=A0AA88EKS7_FICCA|nr:hypothetical protein TIFTF001_053663 [Ficus carica]